MPCPFCDTASLSTVWSSPLSLAFLDRYPVSPGHTLIIPRRHVASWFDATRDEQIDLLDAVDALKRQLDAQLQPTPDGYNVGINAGEAAGQTVMHLHVHLIPRYHGDVDDPAGGVRFVVPAFGDYRNPGRLPRPTGVAPAWQRTASAEQRLVTGGLADPFDQHLRPALHSAQRVRIVAAFVQGSGVERLAVAIAEALERGTHFRVVTGDYLHITQSQALRRLLDWSQTAESIELLTHGTFEVRIIETASIGGRSFHPKSWCAESDTIGTAWVGSSNWSSMALTHGVEWNLRIERALDAQAYAEVAAAFETLWTDAVPLTAAWLDGYADRARQHAWPLIPGEAEDIQPAERFDPIGVQPAALKALQQARAEGRQRALIVLATGLGKTFLAAFDVRAMAEELGRTPRVLFIAHRVELLIQARNTFRKVFPDVSMGLFVAAASELDTDFVFASIQKLTLLPHLESLAPERFDYVIVDESHHAPAESYRRVLKRLEPRFLLGLTATPERADQADVAGLFDDYVAFRADLGEGIDLGRLVPFDYAGLPDTIEFEAIPWRSYTVEQLAALAQTEARMESLLAAWGQYPGSRTLVFCVSISHADYVSEWLNAHGVKIVACHTGEKSAPRDAALEQLERGELHAIAAVDLFNEGLDVPLLDRVVMLRPTDSPVVFLQQLGRGLRVAEGKERLQVIDFIGNHKVFLQRIRTLLSLSPKPTSVREFLSGKDGEIELGSGCHVNVDLEVIDMLRKFLPASAANATMQMYRELRDAREERPTPGELVRMGMNPRSVPERDWFAFVQDEGDLTSAEGRAFESAREWFWDLGATAMQKSFKMVVLETLLDEDALFAGIELDQLAALGHAALHRDPSLRADVDGRDEFDAGPESSAWRAYWRKNPVDHWAKGKWFTVRGSRFTFNAPPLEDAVRSAFVELTRELVDMRLATYRRRIQPSADGASSFVCKVISNQRQPILKLPDRDRDQLPSGDTDVRMEDGRMWQFRFAKIACNLAHPVGVRANALPDLLYRWFGPSAGAPSTSFQVRFRRSPEGWWAEPLGVVIELPRRGEVVSFPSLRAAAGASGEPQLLLEANTVRLPFGGDGRFAVRASGDSMDGGAKPIRDGDWVVLEWARGLGLPAVADRVCLVARGDVDSGQTHHLKRVTQDGDGIHLRSDNPLVDDLEITEDTEVIARLVGIVPPEQLAPARGEEISDVAAAFGLSDTPPPGISRVDGHLFLLVDDKGALSAPDRLPWAVADRLPSETAFVLTASENGWRYAGVGHWQVNAWVFPDVNFETWRRLGDGRSVSRALGPEWVEAADNLVTFLETKHAAGDWVEGRDRRCRFQGRSARGGVRIDHASMTERTVSVTDLAWVLQAHARAGGTGELLDEALVNDLRYLEGTPKSSTRWIDTGWALVLLDDAVRSGFEALLT